jgi:O-antigen/teichoic acid export membrane protein
VNEILRFSFANYIADFFWGVSASILPIIVLNLMGAASTAYFYIAWSIGSVAVIISGAISTSLFAEGSFDEERLGLNILRSLKLILLSIVPVVILVLAIAPKLLLLFGSTYSESGATLLRIIAISALPWSINLVYLSKLRVEKRLGVIIGLTAFIAVLTLGLAYFLLPRMGINGAGIAWLTTQGTMALVVVADSLKRRGVARRVKALIFKRRG